MLNILTKREMRKERVTNREEGEMREEMGRSRGARDERRKE